MSGQSGERRVPQLRVWVITNDRRKRVHSVTSDEAQSIRDLDMLITKYDGDPLSAHRTVALVDAPPSLILMPDSGSNEASD